MKPSSNRPEASSDRKAPRHLHGREWTVDAVDRRLVELLIDEGRMSNAELARRAGLAESTCSVRVRELREHGVLRGIHADVDLARLDLPIEAMIAVRFSGHERRQIDTFRCDVAALPGVIEAFHVAGENDFLIHVCAADPHDLRDFVLDSLTTRPGVVQAQTSLIFERIAGRRVLAQRT